MVDRVSLSKLIDYVLRTDKGERTREREISNREDIKVSLSEAARVLEETNVEERDEKRVEEIKQQLEKGEYEVSNEKIKEGLERFFL